MPKVPSNIYIIGGCNGAGKTTFARDFLPAEVKCLRFLNADEIARGLSPLDPTAGQLKAGRVLLTELHDAIRNHETFSLESTLSGVTYIRLLRQAQQHGYEIELHYIWLATPEQAIARVRRRVRRRPPCSRIGHPPRFNEASFISCAITCRWRVRGPYGITAHCRLRCWLHTAPMVLVK